MKRHEGECSTCLKLDSQRNLQEELLGSKMGLQGGRWRACAVAVEILMMMMQRTLKVVPSGVIVVGCLRIICHHFGQQIPKHSERLNSCKKYPV